MDINQYKTDLRTKYRKIRKEIQPALRRQWDLRIYQNVLDYVDSFQNIPMVYLYLSTKEEADTWELAKRCLRSGVRIAVPKTGPAKGEMHFYVITSFEVLKSGFAGIKEAVVCEEAITDPGLMLVPGVVFDRERHRLGYGGGYYDRYLREHSSKLKTIALAYENQLVDSLLQEEYDQTPDVLITEEMIYE